jgi:Ca2+-binding RTX toxin-like protein
MANQNTVNGEQTTSGTDRQTANRALMVGDLVRATVQADGDVVVKEVLATLKLVDIADVDLLLTFANGDHVVITNGALDAIGPNPPDAVFTDSTISLSELFKLVGIVNPAKVGSLRLVTENIDANPPPEEIAQQTERLPDTPPPAPLVKVGVGTSTGVGKGPGNGVGAGGGEGEVPATVVPPVSPSITTFSRGRPTETVQDLFNSAGNPNSNAALYTSSEFKVTPSGRADLPLGAYDPGATADQLAARYSPVGQSTREVVQGTAGVDAIDFNPAFSANAGQWSKTLHLSFNNYSALDSIQLVFNAAAIAQIPGFDLTGLGVTRDTPTSNSWHIAPTAGMLVDGTDVYIVYNIDDSHASIDFGADLIIEAHVGPILLPPDYINLSFTWRDAVTADDFAAALDDKNNPRMVLPRSGVGVEVFAGNSDDVVNAGAGPDLIHGESGNDTINAGRGNDVLDGGLGADALNGGLGSDTATYENATAGLTATLDTTLGVVNTGEAVGDTYVNIENLKGSIYDDILIGNSIANTLTGDVGNDILVGGDSNDVLDGGSGTDTASYEYANAAVTVSLTTNTGTAGEADGDALVSIENLVGSAYNDTFTGAAGVQANAFDGLGGNDTVSYAPSTTAVVATLTTGLAGVVQTNDALGDTFTNIENLTGSFYADTLIGNASSNIINGGRGNNVLEGLGGADSFIGGTDTDTVSYVHSAAGVVSSLTTVFGAGPAVTQTNDALGDTYASIENMVGTDFADTLIGDGNNNNIAGGLDDDTLEGMGGVDVLDGGIGTDTATYTHSTGYVRASLTTGLAGFTAEGDAAGDVFTSIENLTGSDSNDTLIGNAGANRLTGGAGDDVLEGLGDADILDGGTGSNTASYEHGTDQGSGLGVTASLLTPASNTGDAFGDTYTNIQNLLGSAFNDTLTGDANNNILTGGLGDDTLTGGLGFDLLYGQDGNDSLSDDGNGAEILDGGAGDDIITMTNVDTVTGTVTGGTGTDTLVWAYAAGGQRVNVDMQNGTVYYYINGGTRTNFTGIENFTAAGTNNAYVYANNSDNIIIGGSTGNDWVDYRYAIAGINADLTTGVVTGGSGNDTLVGIEHLYYGTQFNDTLIGNASYNEINGGQGADYINGAGGIDLARYDQFNSGSVTVSLMDSSTNTALGIVFTDTAAGDQLINIEQLIGSVHNDFLYGDGGANYLHGNGGDDVLEGMAGADSLEGASGTDTASYANAGLVAAGSATSGAGVGVIANLTATAFTNGPAVINSGDAAGDTYANIENLTGSTFDDTLVGNGGANVLDGGAGNDVLEGLAGADIFRGGVGIDTVSFAHSNATVTVDISNNGSPALTNDAFGDQYFGIENVTGSNFSDFLYGDTNDNVLIGGLGDDLLDGRGGTDTASYASASGAVTIDLATNTVTGAAGNDTLVNIEKVIGSSASDTITGSAGNDVIEGGNSNDIINGGLGNDTVSYANATGFRNVNLLTGVNTDNDTLTSIENIIGSSAGEALVGDGNDNIIEGGGGNDVLDGGAHGAGGDTASYASATAAVIVSLASGTASGGAGNDTFSNFENITGSSYDDTLTGDGNANRLDGGSGNDLLIGGVGADALVGGAGTDTASYANAVSAVAITINGTGTLGDALGDVLSSIENLIGSDFNDTLTGDGLANIIDGGLGNNIIDGANGVDTINYANASGAMTVNIFNGGTNATGGGRSDQLSGIENIVGSTFSDSLTGDSGNNVIEGGAGGDTLTGGLGTDTASYITSNAGVDVNLTTGIGAGGHAASDTLAGFENLTGSAFNDTLTGNFSANILDGGAGDDVLIGGTGADQLIGGLGADTASYFSASSAVTVNLTTGVGTLGDANGDSFSGIEHLTGSAFNDSLTGDANANTLIGGAGNDTISGGDGDDTIDASSGFDNIFGGNGNDTILVSVSAVNAASQYRGEGNTASLNGGGDTLKLIGLAGSYTLTALANETDLIEILDIRDGINTSLSISSLDVRNFVDGGNTNLWIKADANDVLIPISVAGETGWSAPVAVAGGVDYVIFNSSNVQVAAIHWQTA